MDRGPRMYIMEDLKMNNNKTEVVVKLSLPLVLAMTYAGYKVGQYSVYIKAAKAIIKDESKKNTKD